ncbi:MAG: HNH endonuclease [Acidobacteriaceae bacterium]|nr:HNH endonuclease [Acidobacteriaceae bacterium]MBV9294329.1 HNH endonuclease [Acidobacteriaceae bacterium]MBV9764940.1 HNH endonuclease [Acidobacteriaceae bacterium]
MSTDISEEARRFIAERAGYRCEYCLLHEDDSYSPHQVDHVISRKHGGLSTPENLAYACVRCNVWKGSDIGSIDDAMLSPSFTRVTNRIRSSITEHFLHGMFYILPHGQMCYPCLRNVLLPMSRDGQIFNKPPF